MKKLKNAFVLLLSVAMLASSCTDKEKETPDVRGPILGSYTATQTTTLKFSSIPLMGMPDTVMTDTGEILIENGSDNSQLKISFVDSTDNITFVGSGVGSSSSGIGFNIAQQNIVLDSINVTMQGKAGYTLDGKKYDGTYTTSNKTLKFSYSGSMKIEAFPGFSINLPFEAEVTANK